MNVQQSHKDITPPWINSFPSSVFFSGTWTSKFCAFMRAFIHSWINGLFGKMPERRMAVFFLWNKGHTPFSCVHAMALASGPVAPKRNKRNVLNAKGLLARVTSVAIYSIEYEGCSVIPQFKTRYIIPITVFISGWLPETVFLLQWRVNSSAWSGSSSRKLPPPKKRPFAF